MHSEQKNNASQPETTQKSPRRRRRGISVRYVVIFAMLGALMFTSKVLMEALPNVHLIGVMIVALTVVYRARALYPIYVFVMLTGLYGGFSLWWIPYLYVWTVLWGVTMLLPRRMPRAVAPVVYSVVCAAHGFLFGTLYAPAQALLFGLDFEGMVAWIAAGLYADLLHGIGNLAGSVLIVPLIHLIRRVDTRA